MQKATDHTSEEELSSFLAAAESSLTVVLNRPVHLRVRSRQDRLYSTTWQLESELGEKFLLKKLRARARREAELMQSTQSLFQGDALIQAPFVACQPTPETFLVSWVPGVRLDGLCTVPSLLSFGAWIESRRALLRTAGRWLQLFHDASRELGCFHFDGLTRFVKNRDSVLSDLPVANRNKLIAGLAESGSAESVRVHGDFAPHNILVNGDRLTVIDFAGINEFDRETPWFDVAAMIVALECTWRKRRRNLLRYFSWPVDNMIRAFLEGYCRSAEWPPPLFLCYAVQHLTRLYAQRVSSETLSRMGAWHLERVNWALKQL